MSVFARAVELINKLTAPTTVTTIYYYIYIHRKLRNRVIHNNKNFYVANTH